MKSTLLLSLIGAVFLASVGYAADMESVPFQIVSTKFESGDSITIEEVVASSPQLKIGDTVIVRGKYNLQSKPKASLGLFLTSKGPSAPTPIEPHQQQNIEAGLGSFELKHVIRIEGDLHISFYPQPGGSSFGGVYFGPAKP